LSYAGVERRDAFYWRPRGLSSADRKHGLPIGGRRRLIDPSEQGGPEWMRVRVPAKAAAGFPRVPRGEKRTLRPWWFR